MRRLTIAVAAALLLAAPMSACATLTGGDGLFSQTLADEKALYAAEAAYFGAATAVEAAVDAGLLRGERAAQVARLERAAYNGLVAGRTAQAAGNTAAARVAASEVLGFVASIQAIIRPQPG